MKYDNSLVRRTDRLLDEKEATELLETAVFGTLSMISPEGHPYGIPLTYVWDGNRTLYIHCAPAGRKLECIRHNDRCSFSVVGKADVVPDKFTLDYRSIVLECRASVGLSEEERREALRLYVAKYTPELTEKAEFYIEKSFGRTEIIALTVSDWSGKCKRVLK